MLSAGMLAELAEELVRAAAHSDADDRATFVLVDAAEGDAFRLREAAALARTDDAVVLLHEAATEAEERLLTTAPEAASRHDRLKTCLRRLLTR